MHRFEGDATRARLQLAELKSRPAENYVGLPFERFD
jgi:hypothetical protein